MKKLFLFTNTNLSNLDKKITTISMETRAERIQEEYKSYSINHYKQPKKF